jgi:hypothetical protein
VPEDDTELQVALEIAATCTQLKVLPKIGGLLDQDPAHVRILQTYSNAMVELAEIRRNKK